MSLEDGHAPLYPAGAETSSFNQLHMKGDNIGSQTMAVIDDRPI
jgi:hypothetical protein